MDIDVIRLVYDSYDLFFCQFKGIVYGIKCFFVEVIVQVNGKWEFYWIIFVWQFYVKVCVIDNIYIDSIVQFIKRV